MSPALAQREVALAAVALLAGVGSLAIASRGGHSTTQSRLQPLTLNGGHWRVDLAGGSQVRYGRRTNCSIVLRPNTIGVTDPVLPCGVKLYLAYGNSPEGLATVRRSSSLCVGRVCNVEPTPMQREPSFVRGAERRRRLGTHLASPGSQRARNQRQAGVERGSSRSPVCF